MAMLAASGMEVIGARQIRERDLVSGVVLGAGLGLTALFLYLDVSMTAASNATNMVMFGSMFTIAPETMIPALWVAVLALVMCVLLYRPLLLIAIDPDLATIRGINVRLIGLLYLLTLSIAVALSAMTIGAILSTALLIGPAAAAIRWSRRPASAIIIASVIAIGATWGGILLAYDSFYWAPNRGWPVSFFVVAMIFLAYLASGRTTTLARLRRALAG
jgi:zinc/manganese transport system permease protein